MAESGELTQPGGKSPGSTADQTSGLPHIDISEKGRDAMGKPIALDRRLFMQFMALGGCHHIDGLVEKMQEQSPQAVLYRDLNDPHGIGLLAFCEDPGYIVDTIHPLLNGSGFSDLQPRPAFTMLGRTYSIGYETDLENVLIQRPADRVCNADTPWAVWYPVRRSGTFEKQPREEQRKMLMEHGGIGHAYGKAGYATDIRLAGHGLNTEDNDFIVGLLGKELFPLSALVQHMRRTRQTSEFIERMGPFFVGQAIWQSTPDIRR